MKRWSTFVLIFFTVAAFATIMIDTTPQSPVTPPPLADGTLYSQPYDFANAKDAFQIASGGTYLGADDFVLSSGGTVNQLELWLVYFGTTHPLDLNLFVYTNDTADTPCPGTIVWNETIPSSQIAEVDTGDDLAGNDIFAVTVDLGDGFSVVAGETFWLGVQAVSASEHVNWVVADQLWAEASCWSNDNGATWNSVAFECFFNLYGDAGLTPSTWGEIKSEF